MGQSKEPIRLRQRKTPAGLISLYLDIYLNGQRSYEYLKLYLIPETNKEDKRRNQETLKLAEGYPGETACRVAEQRVRFQIAVQGGQQLLRVLCGYVQGAFQERQHGELGELELLPETSAQILSETETIKMERHRP